RVARCALGSFRENRALASSSVGFVPGKCSGSRCAMALVRFRQNDHAGFRRGWFETRPYENPQEITLAISLRFLSFSKARGAERREELGACEAPLSCRATGTNLCVPCDRDAAPRSAPLRCFSPGVLTAEGFPHLRRHRPGAPTQLRATN